MQNVLVKEWFRRYDEPERLHSESGGNVKSDILHELAKIYDFKRSHTMSFGLEWTMSAFQPDLTRLVADVVFRKEAKEVLQAYNLTPHSSTGHWRIQRGRCGGCNPPLIFQKEGSPAWPLR